ncbi:MAG: 50S ribosomal protein L25/general stress protein Ctc [bacterium]
MAVIQLKGSAREDLGKGGARKARAAGQIPGVIYGRGAQPMAIAVDGREFETALRSHKGGNAIVSLNVAGADHTALIRDVQYDPLTRGIMHLDFQHISLTEQIEVEVAVHFVGTPIGVKDGGGILEHLVRELEVRCLPTAIPPRIDVDVTALNIGDNLHVRDLKVEGFTIVTDEDVTVAAVVAPAAEEATKAAEGAAEPEVVGQKGKKDAEGGESKDAKKK